jgi:hypothetical protein
MDEVGTSFGTCCLQGSGGAVMLGSAQGHGRSSGQLAAIPTSDRVRTHCRWLRRWHSSLPCYHGQIGHEGRASPLAGK